MFEIVSGNVGPVEEVVQVEGGVAEGGVVEGGQFRVVFMGGFPLQVLGGGAGAGVGVARVGGVYARGGA